jgi:hypothetical protein
LWKGQTNNPNYLATSRFFLRNKKMQQILEKFNS